jgi:hypothetical protein
MFLECSGIFVVQVMTGGRKDTILALTRKSGSPSISHPSPALHV